MPEPPARPRDVRDSWAFRVAVVVVVLAAAFLSTRSCASSGDVSQDEAVVIAAEQVEFAPECYQARFYRSGIEAAPTWAVSVWTLDRAGEFGRIAVVQVNADTGDVIDLDESGNSPYTQPQCASPFPP